jgi:hypothetical protein
VCTGGNTIHGSIIVEDNQPTPTGFFNTINNNDVHGDVVVVHNTSTTPFQIHRNRIAKTLKCQNNTPPPTSFLNRAETFEGQCLS